MEDESILSELLIDDMNAKVYVGPNPSIKR